MRGSELLSWTASWCEVQRGDPRNAVFAPRTARAAPRRAGQRRVALRLEESTVGEATTRKGVP